MDALGVELEVVDERLHGALHLGPARRREFGVGGQDLALVLIARQLSRSTGA
jgi:hypothetical protein